MGLVFVFGSSIASNMLFVAGAILFVASRWVGHPSDFPMFVLACGAFLLGCACAVISGVCAAVSWKQLARWQRFVGIEPLICAATIVFYVFAMT
jgi:hypothetical protein